MNSKWDNYAHFPASGEEFERYVGTVFDDLGYKVYLTPRKNDYGVDLLLEEPETEKRIAVQTKFYNKSSLGNTPIQEVLAGLPLYDAEVGWVVTNGRFTENAANLAKANGVRLIDNDGLNELIDKAKDARNKAMFAELLKAENEAERKREAQKKDEESLKKTEEEKKNKLEEKAQSDLERASKSESEKSDRPIISHSLKPADVSGADRGAHAAPRSTSTVTGDADPQSSVSFTSGSPVHARSTSSAIHAPNLASVPNIAPTPNATATPNTAPAPNIAPTPNTAPNATPAPNAAPNAAPTSPLGDPSGSFQYVTVLNMPDIQARWGCSVEDVMDQIAQGMPMVQFPGGIWGITQADLLAWEAHMADVKRENLRHQQIFSLIFIGSAVIIFAICILLLIYNGFFD